MKFLVGFVLPLVILCASLAIADPIDETSSTEAPVTSKDITDVPPTTTTKPSDNTTTTTTTPTTSTEPTTSTSTSTTTQSTTTTPETTTPSTTTSSEKPTTTVSPVTTVSPSPAPAPIPKHWSTTSFIGGMVFAFGLVAIAFVAFKFYKARNERNYHTL